MKGTCRLCHRSEVGLRRSHLMPRAGYSRIAKSQPGIQPLATTTKNSRLTNDQAYARLLCKDCENRLNKNGEHWMLSHCFRQDGQRFPLKDALEAAHPEGDYGEGGQLYAASKISNIDVAQAIYFATSIFWRSSVHNWRLGKEALPLPALDQNCNEEFRQFLLGNAGFPVGVTLQLSISTDSRLFDGFSFPCGGRNGDHDQYHFLFFGCLFMLYIGDLVPTNTRQLCFANSSSHFIFRGKSVDEWILDRRQDFMSNSRPVGQLKI